MCTIVFADDEKEKSIEYIKSKDKNRDVFSDSKYTNDSKSDYTEEEKDFIRAQDFFYWEEYEGTDDDTTSKDSESQNYNVDNKGKGAIKAQKLSIVLFQCLFIFFCILSIFIGFQWHSNIVNSLLNEGTGIISSEYILVFSIFILEIIIVIVFFKQYYRDYLLKLFARNV